MPKDELPNFRYRGARACILLHEQIMRQFLETWKQAKAAGISLPESKSPHYDSLETLLHHVLDLAMKYMVWICEKLELPDPGIQPAPGVDRIEAEVDSYMEHLFEQYRQPLVDVEGRRFYQPGYPAPWNVDYCIDAMLEHAVMHPMRHRFQLLELLEGEVTIKEV
jgi:hypothetical protein